MLKDCDAQVIACLAASFQGAYTHGVICLALSCAMLCSRERSAPWNDRNAGVNALSLQASVRPQAACTTMSAAPLACAAATHSPEKHESSSSTSIAPLAEALEVRHNENTCEQKERTWEVS